MSKMSLEIIQKQDFFAKAYNSAIINLRKDSFSKEKLNKIKSNEEKYISMPRNRKFNCTGSKAVLAAVNQLLKELDQPEQINLQFK